MVAEPAWDFHTAKEDDDQCSATAAEKELQSNASVVPAGKSVPDGCHASRQYNVLPTNCHTVLAWRGCNDVLVTVNK